MSNPEYYTVSQVAERFSVSGEAVRGWIRNRQLMAVQPAGEGGVYRIPIAAVRVFENRRSGKVAPVPRSQATAIKRVDPGEFFAERIQPVLAETGFTADEVLRRLLTDSRMRRRYSSFASDYGAYVRSVEEAVSKTGAPRTMSAGG